MLKKMLLIQLYKMSLYIWKSYQVLNYLSLKIEFYNLFFRSLDVLSDGVLKDLSVFYRKMVRFIFFSVTVSSKAVYLAQLLSRTNS